MAVRMILSLLKLVQTFVLYSTTVCKVEKSSHLTEDFSINTQSRHLIPFDYCYRS